MFDYIQMTYKYSNDTIMVGIMHWPKRMILIQNLTLVVELLMGAFVFPLTAITRALTLNFVGSIRIATVHW